MSYGMPPAYPPGYGLTSRPSAHPSARYAGILLLILGILTLLLGGCFGVMGAIFPMMQKSPEFQNNPDLQRMIAEGEQAGINFSIIFYILAAILLFYAITAIVLGITLMKASGKWAAILGIVFVGLSILFFGAAVYGQLLADNLAGILIPVILLGLNGLLMTWLIQAVRAPSAPGFAPAMYPTPPGYYPPGYGQPMQGYQYPTSSSQSPNDQQQPPSA